MNVMGIGSWCAGDWLAESLIGVYSVNARSVLHLSHQIADRDPSIILLLLRNELLCSWNIVQHLGLMAKKFKP